MGQKITTREQLANKKKNKLKMNKQSDSDSDEEIVSDESGEESGEESEEELDEEESEDTEKGADDADDEDDDDDEEYNPDEDDGEEVFDKVEYDKLLADLFPSNYSSKKALDSQLKKTKKNGKSRVVEDDSESSDSSESSSSESCDSSDSSDSESDKKKKSSKKSSKSNKKSDKKTTSESKKSKKSKNSDETAEEDKKSKKSAKSSSKKSSKSNKKSDDKKKKNANDSDEDDNEGLDDNKINIILSLDPHGDEYEKEYADYFGENSDSDEDEECDTDDEETFMKEKFEKVENTIIPKKKKKAKDTKSETSDMMSVNVESEYSELLDMKKDLTKKLEKKPASKFLRRALKNCNVEIKELVTDARKQNAKEYRKLVYGDASTKISEISYFKKKLSNSQQLKVMKELKEINDVINIEKPYRLLLLESSIPPLLKAQAMQKLNVLKSMEPGDSEYYKIKHWIDNFMKIPFGKYQSLDVNMSHGLDACHEFMVHAKKTLDECVYGLDDAKLQIMQMLGQWITNPDAMGTAIAIKGPPGTGKTTLVKEGISKILGREFAFIPLGGTGDASFLEGHSYTYEGSSWGKIVQILMTSKCMNPVIYFDELDKISSTPRGEEITGVLTHLTDTTQNSQYHDKYFSDIDFDMSKCLYIFSYNVEENVNPILKDRMYRIETKGYDAKEKLIIAKQYMLPKIREQVNFAAEDLIIPDDTIQYIISAKHLTHEEMGVRNMKRCLEIIHTKLNLFRLMKPDTNIFAKDMGIEVTFPFTVLRKHVDLLIKNEEKQSQSLLSMYI